MDVPYFCPGYGYAAPRINNPSIALSKSIQEGIKLIVIRSFWRQQLDKIWIIKHKNSTSLLFLFHYLICILNNLVLF